MRIMEKIIKIIFLLSLGGIILVITQCLIVGVQAKMKAAVACIVIQSDHLMSVKPHL